MNYRHIFHAGHICDVVKHAALTLLLGHLREKDKAFAVLDTHAGIGLYDLQDERAQKTGEAQQGIFRLLAAPPVPELADYYRVLREINPDWPILRFYPGSPVLTRRLMRTQDRLIACELHPEDFAELRKQFRNDKQAQLHNRDGYEALGAFLPPAEKRGLVLIDPPFEAPDEFQRLAEAVEAAHIRWSQGIFMIWYPVKDRPAIWKFHEALIAAGISKTLCAEFMFEEETRTDRLNGSGLIVVNPPWQFEDKLRALFFALHEALQTTHRESAVKWLGKE